MTEEVTNATNLKKERLLSIIEFAQHSARLKLTPVQDVKRHKSLCFFENELIGLPGISFNKSNENDEIWLKIERLWESHPPQPKEKILDSWINLTNSTEKKPSLKDFIESNENDNKNSTEKTKSIILFSELENPKELDTQLDFYIKTQWLPWSYAEKKRRKTIKYYSELFKLKQQLDSSISEELLWGLGIGIWKTNDFNISYPLITQSVVIQLNEKSMALEIKPMPIQEKLDLEPYLDINNPGISDLKDTWQKIIKNQTQTFSPFDKLTYEAILEAATTHLDPKGTYWPRQTSQEDRSLPNADERLKITDTWVLFSRPRSKSDFIQDLENFKNKINEHEGFLISKVIDTIVSEPSDTHQEIILPKFRGISTYETNHSSASTEFDLYFPMPFNEEQVNIVKRLECFDGVVVQGPPGTGKTHTIANIISHYLANGKRVLVTSMREPALSVLKQKLPKNIQELAIVLLKNEQDGREQFERSVHKISQELQIIDRNLLSKEIKNLEDYLDELHSNIAYTNREINAWAKKNIDSIVIDKKSITPEKAAEEIVAGAGQFEWLEDTTPAHPEQNLYFNNDDILKLREARREINKDLDYLNTTLPEINTLPTSDEIAKIHRQICRNGELKKLIKDSSIPNLSDQSDDTYRKSNFLIENIISSISLANKINSKCGSWAQLTKNYLKNEKDPEFSIIFENLINEIKRVSLERRKFLEKPVFLGNEIHLNSEIISALQNKANGKSAFGLRGLLAKRQLNKEINKIKIINELAKNQDDWEYVLEYSLLLSKTNELILRWNQICKEIYMPSLEIDDIENSLKIAKNHIEAYHEIKENVNQEREILLQFGEICPTWEKDHLEPSSNEQLEKLKEILKIHIDLYNSSKAFDNKDKIIMNLSRYTGRICENLIALTKNKLGNPTTTEIDIKNEWDSLLKELRRILSLRPYFLDIKEICERMVESDAPLWAEKISTKPSLSINDPLLPDNWHQAWRLCRLSNYFKSINSYEEFKNLNQHKQDTQIKLEKTYQEIAVKRAWLKLSSNATQQVKSALQAFRAAITKMGKGSGKRATRYRRDAQDASQIISGAIPCWIMTHDQVSRSLPSDFECFDLVIIDEASQSDLSALPAIFRAKKILVVGDDKQVSPEGVGLEDEKIITLMKRYLSNQVELYSRVMSPERSIYDLFKVVFSESQIMLREHFRCIAPIIEYSKREFYNHELKPLRIPKKSERLSPPLIDVLVEDGDRKEKKNEAEAKFICSEIKKITSDPNMKNLTIGVISLLGNEQSAVIWGMIEKEIGPELMTQHDITCGDAHSFQGKERNIIFLSMVVTKDFCHADNKESSAQRFNVAASRAKDRMYLVRSVELDELSPKDTLRRRLIQHFHSPFAQNEEAVEDNRILCESNFEREVYDILTERGYKVIPQVKVGNYRIDMVVEGNQDARLAIECDGDKYHGEDRWEADMVRQRILERAGWQFWRCFASTFTLYKNKMIEDLINTLKQHNIEPIGHEGKNNNIHSEHRRVKAFPKRPTEEFIELVAQHPAAQNSKDP